MSIVYTMAPRRDPSAMLREQSGSVQLHVCLQTFFSEWAEDCGTADSSASLLSVATPRDPRIIYFSWLLNLVRCCLHSL